MEMNKLFNYDTVDEIMKNKELSDYDIYTDITPEGILIETSEWNLFQNEKITWEVLKELIYKEILDFKIELDRDTFDENIEYVKEEIDDGMDIFVYFYDGDIKKASKDELQYIDDNEMWYIREVKNKHIHPFGINYIHYENFRDYESKDVKFELKFDDDIYHQGDYMIWFMYNDNAIHLFASDIIDTICDTNIDEIIEDFENNRDFVLKLTGNCNIKFERAKEYENIKDAKFICQNGFNGYMWFGTEI